jgi:catechol 2,3-dioxygenase-like lactoylglutathione lyase family enzyme
VFERVSIRADDLEASVRFYATVLAPLGGGAGDWAVVAATARRPATQRLHVGFFAPSRAHVDAFWQAGVDAGHADDGAPGPRPQYRDDYYGAFLLDPGGNSAEAVHHGDARAAGQIDHLWIRVTDLAAARASWGTRAGDAGWREVHAGEDRVQLKSPDGPSFSLVPGEPTRHVDIALRGGVGLEAG